MAKKAAKQARVDEKLTQDDKDLLASFYRAVEETSPLPGVTIDIRDIARSSVQAYWAAREQAAAQSDGTGRQARIPEFSRFDFVRHIWATIDPAREFMREILSSALPTVAGVIFLVTGYIFLTRGEMPPLPWLPSAVGVIYAASAIFLIFFFWARREAILKSKWRVVQTSSGSLAGGLIAGTFAVALTVFSLHQTTQVDQYEVSLITVKGEAELAKTVNEIQSVAASVLVANSTDVDLDHRVEEQVKRLELAREAALTVVRREPERVVYRVNYRDRAAESGQPLTLTFTPDSIKVQRKEKVEYTIVRGLIEDANNNSMKLLVRDPTFTQRTLNVSNEKTVSWRSFFEAQQGTSLKGKDVIITYSFNENAPTRVDLLNARTALNLYSSDSLADRIQKLSDVSTAHIRQAGFRF